NITWSETDSIDIMTNILQPVVTRVIKETIALQAVVVDPNGCGRDTFVRIIKPVRVPNVFSPNNDMTNDRFNIVIPNESEEGNIQPGDIEDFKVYNRWGQVVYENTNPTLGWDGTHNGDPAPSDVYIYVIKIRTSNESTSVLKGDVTLLR
ncbi:MAG TPA: gliding motility-associated C-terminal domain-containing protein, partial [Saprospiraceae bacterium]|nr:gliding motility-associated C-terminal domain-containing protein [Saprospiraceae bacterium]